MNENEGGSDLMKFIVNYGKRNARIEHTEWKWKWQQQTFIMHRLFKWSEVNKNICNSLIIIIRRSYFSKPHTGYCHHFFIYFWLSKVPPSILWVATAAIPMNYVILSVTKKTNLHFAPFFCSLSLSVSMDAIRQRAPYHRRWRSAGTNGIHSKNRTFLKPRRIWQYFGLSGGSERVRMMKESIPNQ